NASAFQDKLFLLPCPQRFPRAPFAAHPRASRRSQIARLTLWGAFSFRLPFAPIPRAGCITAPAKEKAPLQRDFLVTPYRLFPPLWPVPAAAQRRPWGW